MPHLKTTSVVEHWVCAVVAGISRSVARVIGEVLGAHYYSHRRIESLCRDCGFSGEPPLGNCVDKLTSWINREAAAAPDLVLKKVGQLLCEFMDSDSEDYRHTEGRKRIENTLAKEGLTYYRGGHILGSTVSTPSHSLDDLMRKRSIPEIEVEFQRALKSLDSDPPAAITAACSILESFCRIYIQEENLSLPPDKSAKSLWKIVARHIRLAPESQTDQDINKVLSGLFSVVDGLASLRTHDGSAHGKERRPYKILPSHARLAVHASHTLVLFGLETWAASQQKRAQPCAAADDHFG